MQIVPPKIIVQHLIDNPQQNFNSYADQMKILAHNDLHTEEYIVSLLHTLNSDDLEIAHAEELHTTIRTIKPKEIEFIFEERIGKWVDGSDYPYYVLIGINENPSNKAL